MMNPVLNRLVFVFSLIGIIVAGYLWYMHGHPEDIPCGASHGCGDVAASPYSQFPPGSGPPVAAFGTLGYIAIATLSFLRTLPGMAKQDRTLLLLMLSGAAMGSAFSLWLTYLEINVIHAICRWCIGSQTIILILLTLTVAEWAQYYGRKANSAA
jgi:uncharacterized membrane protein